jgi:hypothetical protein
VNIVVAITVAVVRETLGTTMVDVAVAELALVVAVEVDMVDTKIVVVVGTGIEVVLRVTVIVLLQGWVIVDVAVGHCFGPLVEACLV